MSDRIAVFSEGRVEQVATPVTLYEHPASPFVAGFVGTSNLRAGTVARRLLGGPGPFSIRPEKIRLSAATVDGGAAEPGAVRAPGTVADVAYLGSATHTIVDIGDGTRVSVLQPNQDKASSTITRRGDPVLLSWQRAQVVSLGPSDPGIQSDVPANAGGRSHEEHR